MLSVDIDAAIPAWEAVHTVAWPEVPRPWYPWLRDTASMTEKLQQQFVDVAITPVKEGWDSYLPRETLLLEAGGHAWVRHTCIHRQAQQLIFARVVLPQAGYHAVQDWLPNLGDQFLGQVLFQRYTVTRSHIQAIYWQAQRLWGRQSLLHFADNQRLLVAELFAADFLQQVA